jgi:hypothetical protein
MIRFCSDKKASTDTSVIGVCGPTSCRQDSTSTLSALGMASSVGGADILLSTLLGLNGNKPLAAKPALIFFGVNAFSPCGAIQRRKVLLADRIYTSLFKSINLVTISCLK